MNNQLIIIGSGGHGKVCYSIAKKLYKKIIFLDDNILKNPSGKVSDYKKYLKNSDFFIAIGNNKTREMIFNMLNNSNANIISLIHETSCIDDDVVIEKGTLVMPGCVINAGSKIGKCCIINTCSSIDHDNNIGDFSHISVAAHTAGSVNIGKRVFLCAGAIVINNINVTDDVIIGAGSTLINNINEEGTYVGTPAHKIK